MGKSQKNSRIKTVIKKTGRAAGKIKAVLKDFLVKVNPGP